MNINLIPFILLFISVHVYGQAQVNIDQSKIKTYTLKTNKNKSSKLDKYLNFYIFNQKDSLELWISSLETKPIPFSTKDKRKRAVLQLLSQQLDHSDSVLTQIDLYIHEYVQEHRDAYSLALFYEKSRTLNKRGEYQATISLLKDSFFNQYPTNGDFNTLALLSKIYGNRYKAYSRTNQYSKALESAIITENIALELDNVKLLFDATSLFSELYGTLSSPELKLGTEEDRQRYKELLEVYLKKGVDLSKKGLSDASSAIATYNMALHYVLNNQLEKSKKYLDQAINYGQRIEYHQLLFNAYDVLSDMHMDANQLDSSFYYITLAKKEADAIAYPYLSARSDMNFLNYYTTIKAFSKASKLFDHLGNEKIIDDFLRLKKTYYLMGYELEKAKGNFEQSLDYFVIHQNIKDSITNLTNTSTLETLRAKYESELKDKEIKFLSTQSELDKSKIKKKNQFILFTIGVGIVFIGLLSFFFQQRQKLEKERTLNAKQKLLRTQLNPHFLFNVLNSIQQYIYQKEDPQKIANYLAKFSQLTRRILLYSKEDFISLEEELKFIQDYMDMQKIRFDRPFSYTIDIASNLEIDDILIPPMFTQPFIENAIEHGIFSKIEKGTIKIQIKSENDMLVVILEDNGIGIEKTKLFKKNQQHNSLAIKITRERLKILEKKFKQKVKLSILDISDNKNIVTGTKIQLTIPLVYQ